VDDLVEKGFKEVQSISKYKMSFNPKKNAFINSVSQCKSMLYFAEQGTRRLEGVDSTDFVKQDQWFAH